ncbi:MAG: hypothetical protein AAB554_01435 [Patescibacteria group bacterium]
MEDEIRQIASLFQEAFRTLTTAKCHATARAAFNRAQTMLDSLECHPDSRVVGEVKKMRKTVRAAVGYKDKSLRRTMEIYAAYWTQVVQQFG